MPPKKSTKPGEKRHRKVLRDNILGITKPAIRRISHKAGVKSLEKNMYDEVRSVIRMTLENILRVAITFCENQRRKVIMVEDIINAFETHYGIKLAYSKTFNKHSKAIGRCH